MQKFAAFVVFLRRYKHNAMVGLPLLAIWYFVHRNVAWWFFYDHFLLIWCFKHRTLPGEIALHVSQGLGIALAFGLLGSFLVFQLWVLMTSRTDLEFTSSSVVKLVTGSMLIGFYEPIICYTAIPWIAPLLLGSALLWLETYRMKVLASTY